MACPVRKREKGLRALKTRSLRRMLTHRFLRFHSFHIKSQAKNEDFRRDCKGKKFDVVCPVPKGEKGLRALKARSLRRILTHRFLRSHFFHTRRRSEKRRFRHTRHLQLHLIKDIIMNNPDKLYAVVRFVENNTFSEIPTNWLYSINNEVKCWWPTKTRNVTSYIANRFPPDKTTWDLCDIEIEQLCDTWEKSRKIAEDPSYKTTDDENLGKGYRTKYHKNRYSSSSESDIDDKDTHASNKTKGKNKCIKLKPKVTSCISVPPNLKPENWDDSHTLLFDGNLNVINASNDVASGSKTIVEDNLKNNEMEEIVHEILKNGNEISNLSDSQSKETVPKDPVTINEEDTNKERLFQDIAIIKEHYLSIRRMHATIIVTLKSIDQRLSKMEQKSSASAEGTRYNLIETFLPLKDLDNIKNFENFLSLNNAAVKQYRNFITNIGGHTIKDNINRVLRNIFTDDSAKLCSWKGRKNNFPVYQLQFMREIKNVISLSHESMKDLEFEEISAEWFRFAKQRASRQNKDK